MAVDAAVSGSTGWLVVGEAGAGEVAEVGERGGPPHWDMNESTVAPERGKGLASSTPPCGSGGESQENGRAHLLSEAW